ncbi:MAG: dihydroneopterin aldolase [Pseudomonadota bacterium]
MDTVFIRKLKVEGVIGVHAWERKRLRTLLLDIELDTDIRKAAKADDLKHALDYHRVAEVAAALVRDSQFQLIESLAEALAAKLLGEFAASTVRISVHKPGAVAHTETVGVKIERKK